MTKVHGIEKDTKKLVGEISEIQNKFLKKVNALELKGLTWSLELGLIDFDKKFGFMYFGDAPFIFKWFNQNLKPDQWQHLCYTVTSKEIHVVMNGEVLLNQTQDCPKCTLTI